MNDKIKKLAARYAEVLEELEPYGDLDRRLSVADYRQFTSAEVNVRLVASALVEGRFPITINLLTPSGAKPSVLRADDRQQLEDLYAKTLAHGIQVAEQIKVQLNRS